MCLPVFVIKPNVEGDNCDRCKPDTFGLSLWNPLGCSKCYCYGLTQYCTEAQGLIRMLVSRHIQMAFLLCCCGYCFGEGVFRYWVKEHFIKTNTELEVSVQNTECRNILYVTSCLEPVGCTFSTQFLCQLPFWDNMYESWLPMPTFYSMFFINHYKVDISHFNVGHLNISHQ